MTRRHSPTPRSPLPHSQPAVLSSSDTSVFVFVRLLVGSDDSLVSLAFFVKLRFAFRVMYKQCGWLYDELYDQGDGFD